MTGIRVLKADGTEYLLDAMPTLKEMQAIVGGYIERVRVLDRVEDGQGIYKYMIVNEEGLDVLPRNEKATVEYQRNSRTAFPNAENPFLAAIEGMKKQYRGSFTIVTARPEYEADPYICGDVILFPPGVEIL